MRTASISCELAGGKTSTAKTDGHGEGLMTFTMPVVFGVDVYSLAPHRFESPPKRAISSRSERSQGPVVLCGCGDLNVDGERRVESGSPRLLHLLRVDETVDKRDDISNRF